MSFYGDIWYEKGNGAAAKMPFNPDLNDITRSLKTWKNHYLNLGKPSVIMYGKGKRRKVVITALSVDIYPIKDDLPMHTGYRRFDTALPNAEYAVHLSGEFNQH
jgi:hypothetical protein